MSDALRKPMGQQGFLTWAEARRGDEFWATTIPGEGEVLALPGRDVGIPPAALHADITSDASDLVSG